MKLCRQFAVIGFVMFHSITECAAANPTTNCTEYVPEGEDLSCSCLPPEGFTGDATYSWPGHSTASQLTLRNVSRQDNGTQYTCLMSTGDSSTSTVYTLKVAYGPYEEHVQIEPTMIVTNGSQVVALSCSATEVYPTPNFAWTQITCSSIQGSTCTFTPEKPFNQSRATCIVILEGIDKAVVKTIQLTYKYPPWEPPVITSSTANNLLKTGDKLTCAVTGGQPPVDTVIFYCSNPDHSDQSDEANSTTVSSTVTVNSSQTTETNMTCYCSAIWNTRPELYTLKAEATYIVEHRAVVKSLTLNGIAKALTVKELDNVTLQLLCETYARPAADDVNISNVVNVTSGRLQGDPVNKTGNWTTWKTVTLIGVQYYDMGRYVCTASNGLWGTDQMRIQLNVESMPRKKFDDDLGNADNGVTFNLTAYPVPASFTFYHLGNQTANNGTEVSSSMFSSSCQQDAVIMYLVTCTIMPVNVPASLLGSYRASVSNGLGSVELLLFIQREVSIAKDSLSGGAIAGIVVGIIVFIVIICILVVFLVKRKNAKLKDFGKQTADGHNNATFSKNESDDNRTKRPVATVQPRELNLSEPGYTSADELTNAPQSHTPSISSGYASIDDCRTRSLQQPQQPNGRVSVDTQGYAKVQEKNPVAAEALYAVTTCRAERPSAHREGESSTMGQELEGNNRFAPGLPGHQSDANNSQKTCTGDEYQTLNKGRPPAFTADPTYSHIP